jgi:hypothetical protein
LGASQIEEEGRMKSLDGGTWVDLFGVIILARLIAVFFHFPPLTMQEAGLWSCTVGAFAYSNHGPKGQA